MINEKSSYQSQIRTKVKYNILKLYLSQSALQVGIKIRSVIESSVSVSQRKSFHKNENAVIVCSLSDLFKSIWNTESVIYGRMSKLLFYI